MPRTVSTHSQHKRAKPHRIAVPNNNKLRQKSSGLLIMSFIYTILDMSKYVYWLHRKARSGSVWWPICPTGPGCLTAWSFFLSAFRTVTKNQCHNFNNPLESYYYHFFICILIIVHLQNDSEKNAVAALRGRSVPRFNKSLPPSYLAESHCREH